MANVLQAVETYNNAALALLTQLNPWIYKSNKKFIDFNQKVPKNLGDTVTFRKPSRFLAKQGLTVTFQDTVERVQSLAVDQAQNVGINFTAEELIFNVDTRIKEFVQEGVAEIGQEIGTHIAGNAIRNTFRSFGNGVTPINSWQQYAQAIANFDQFGSAKYDRQMIVSSVDMPSVISQGQDQFVPMRNDSNYQSYEMGSMMNTNFCSSDLIPVHRAGTVGNNQEELTLTAISPDGGTLTFSGASASEPVALAQYDILTFDAPGSTNVTGLRFLAWTGHNETALAVQTKVTADAASDGAGNVVVTVEPALIFDVNDAERNVNIDIAASLLGILNAKTAPDHKAGLMMAGNPLFLAMPTLPDKSPYSTVITLDDTSGAAFRSYYGAEFTNNSYGFISDCIYGSTLPAEYAMRIVYPLAPANVTFTSAYGAGKALNDAKAKEAKAKVADKKAA